MRILIIQPGIGPYRIDFFNLLANCCALKIVYFFEDATGQTFPEPLSLKLKNCEVERVDGGVNLRSYYPIRPRLNKVIKDFNPDIVVGYEFNTLALHLLMLRKILRSQWSLLIWTSDNISTSSSCKFPRSFFRYFISKMTDGMLLYSQEVKDYYVRHLIPVSKSFVLPNIQAAKNIRSRVDESLRVAIEYQQRHNLAGKKIFLFVGRLVPVKNLSRFIQSWHDATSELADVRFIFVGSGPLESEIKAFASRENEDRIILAGSCYDQELWAWYRLADCLVLPSIFEPFGAVVNEALAAGVPCLVSEKAGSSCLINSPEQGELIDPYSIEDMRDKVRSICQRMEPHDHSELPASLMPWDLDVYVDGFIKFCNKIIGRF